MRLPSASSNAAAADHAAAGLLERLLRAGMISALDSHFARALAALGEASETVLASAALASRAVQLGHVCLDLESIQELANAERARLERRPEELESPPELPPAAELRAALRASSFVSDGSTPAPLVLDSAGRLYLQRYAAYERELAAVLLERARTPIALDPQLLREPLARWLGPRAHTAPHLDPRTMAACVALFQRLAVICGGPGTGKTTLVVRILALLQEQALSEGEAPLDILLLAPTGKAAQRLGTSVARGLDELGLDERLRASIPREASTIHRALGRRRAGTGRFRQEARDPLPADVVVVDEVSMVDLVLLHQLVMRVRPEARLILQGDKDQLASVEAGAILGDIYDAGAARLWSPTWLARVREAIPSAAVTATDSDLARGEPGLGDCLVSLEESYRYAADSGIGQLARAINQGDAQAALAVLEGGAVECRRVEPALQLSHAGSRLEQLAQAGYAPFIHSRDPEEKLARLEAYRILCAHRQGLEGVERLNRQVEQWLGRARLIEPEGPYYENRPLLITQNDYTLGLFNGDVGVVVRDARGRLRACFAGARGLRFFAPGRLPPHETVFAMTVHKSQGSEFDAVTVVLPLEASPLLGRELLYTAVTRARKRVEVFASRAVLSAAVSRPVRRASGLHAALWRH